MSNPNVMILKSIDGQEFNRVLIVPENLTNDEAESLFKRIRAEVQTEDPIEWDWDKMETALQAAGFVIPCWFHGPTWDWEPL